MVRCYQRHEITHLVSMAGPPDSPGSHRGRSFLSASVRTVAVVSLDELLRAVAAGRISRLETEEYRGFWALYQLDDGSKVERWALNMLRKRSWIDLPMLGPPAITPDGQKHLTS